jgi:hypothetical protein
MKNITHTFRRATAVVAVASVGLVSPAVATAAPPIEKVNSTALGTDDGAFVRIVGDPSYGTVKFQFGWSAGTDASMEAVGYWVGVYDITRSTYVWVMATDDKGAMDLPEQFFRNARPTVELPIGEYKVNFFVRDSYGDPVTNVAEIELEFSVTTALP